MRLAPVPPRSQNRAAFLLLLLVLPLAYVRADGERAGEPSKAGLRKITVRVKDEHGRYIRDLHQDDFVLEEDERVQVIEWWKKSDEFGRVRYELGYRPHHRQDNKTFGISVHVNRAGARVDFSPKRVK